MSWYSSIITCLKVRSDSLESFSISSALCWSRDKSTVPEGLGSLSVFRYSPYRLKSCFRSSSVVSTFAASGFRSSSESRLNSDTQLITALCFDLDFRPSKNWLMYSLASSPNPTQWVSSFQRTRLYRYRYWSISSSNRGARRRCLSFENLLSVRIRRHREWIVPIYIFEISKCRLVFVVTIPRSVRNPSFSWSAAFSVKVERKISSGFTLWNTTRFNVRHRSTRVLPEPGPAGR